MYGEVKSEGFPRSTIRALYICYGKFVDVYLCDYDYPLEKFDKPDSTVRLRVVDAIETFKVAGQCGWVEWFDIYSHGLTEVVNPAFVVKVVYYDMDT